MFKMFISLQKIFVQNRNVPFRNAWGIKISLSQKKIFRLLLQPRKKAHNAPLLIHKCVFPLFYEQRESDQRGGIMWPLTTKRSWEAVIFSRGVLLKISSTLFVSFLFPFPFFLETSEVEIPCAEFQKGERGLCGTMLLGCIFFHRIMLGKCYAVLYHLFIIWQM